MAAIRITELTNVSDKNQRIVFMPRVHAMLKAGETRRVKGDLLQQVARNASWLARLNQAVAEGWLCIRVLCEEPGGKVTVEKHLAAEKHQHAESDQPAEAKEKPQAAPEPAPEAPAEAAESDQPVESPTPAEEPAAEEEKSAEKPKRRRRRRKKASEEVSGDKPA